MGFCCDTMAKYLPDVTSLAHGRGANTLESPPRRAPPGRVQNQMRILLYNIRYATGTGPAFHLPVPGAGYLRSNRQVLEGITRFIKGADPDIVGLIEVDTG